MGLLDTLLKPAEQLGLPDPIEALSDPGGAGQQLIDIFRDPLSGLQGLPGIDGNEAADDGGQLEIARQDLIAKEAKDRKKKALLSKQSEGTSRQSTIKTGSQGLATQDSASIATRSLLG